MIDAIIKDMTIWNNALEFNDLGLVDGQKYQAATWLVTS